jgi:glutamate formiminotransferase/formiminotetrahydrofolate cyclodeaminase
MDEVAEYAHKLGEMAGSQLDIPFYMYEHAATKPERQNLATVRAGEYEGLPDKLQQAEWKPDYGPAQFNPKAGATAIGARDFLIAYNVNLNTTSTRRTNSVAFDVREKGRVKREGGKLTGKIIRDEEGNPKREPGMCKGVKGIGWYIEEYGICQISMNITDIRATPLHEAFEACRKSANSRGLRVTGSELVGLVPKQVMIDAGEYFLKQQERSLGIHEDEIIKIAVKSLGLDELGPFDPEQKIIEYMLEEDESNPLINMTLEDFADETASESMAPGGGSISAYVGSLGAALATMVANLSAHKRGWDDRWEEFSEYAEKGQKIKDRLNHLVDEDTRAFNAIINAFRMPKTTEEEKEERQQAIIDATKQAIEVPFQTMKAALEVFPLAKAMVEKGNPNSVTDAGVGALCAKAAIAGAFMNVKVNAGELDDKEYVNQIMKEANSIMEEAAQKEEQITTKVHKRLDDS